MLLPICNQEGCLNTPAYRFTWPGRDEACICEEHSNKLKRVADAIGLYIQFIPLVHLKGEEE